MPNVASWINTGGTTVVGTATIASSVFTDTAHGLTNGTAVEFDTITGGAIGILIEGHEYVVRNATTDTYQVSDTPGGELMVIASGGAQARLAVPESAAVDLRRLDTLMLHPGSADRWGARTGVRPHSTAAVTLSGTQWTVQETLATVYPRETSTSAPYRVAIERTTGALTAADGSNPRIDALDIYIQDDDEDGSGERRVPPVLYTAGTPASSPTAPTLASGRLRLATILVPAGGSPAPSISTEAQFSHGPGILPARTTAERPTAGRHEGMYVDRWDTDTLERWDGSAWTTVASAATVTAANTAVRRIATTTRTTNTSSFTAETLINSVTASLVSGATYRVRWVMDVQGTVINDMARARLRQDTIAGTTMQLVNIQIPRITTDFQAILEAEYTAAATGNKTFVATCMRQAGTGDMLIASNSNEPSYLYVDYIRG